MIVLSLKMYDNQNMRSSQCSILRFLAVLKVAYFHLHTLQKMSDVTISLVYGQTHWSGHADSVVQLQRLSHCTRFSSLVVQN